MHTKTTEELRMIEFRKLRRDYDYLWQVHGRAIPQTKAKLLKFTEKLISILDVRLGNANLHRSHVIVTPLPEDLDYIEDNSETSGITRVEA